MSFLIILFEIWKWVSSSILNSKFNSEVYFSHSFPFASIWYKGQKTMMFNCRILLEHFSCSWCIAMTSYTNLICKHNVLFISVICRCVSLSAEALRYRQNILTIEQYKLLYTLQNKIDKCINKIKTLELFKLTFNLIKYCLLLFPQHLQYWCRHFSHNFFARKSTDMLKLKWKLIHLTLLLLLKIKIYVSDFRTQFLTFYFYVKSFNMNS